MTVIGYHASHEQISPDLLLRHVQAAGAAGFDAAMCSDHWAPWSHEQGQSGHAWAWLGAALQATSLSFGVVNAPGQRYHPTLIAQAAATLNVMYPGRFWVAIGSGEHVNEHITGDPWPSKAERNERLRQCADVMRRLWGGETVTQAGLVNVHEAKLWTRPERPPMLVGAAVTAETAGWMAQWVDALITVNQAPDVLDGIVHAFRSNGGQGKPLILQVHLAWAPNEHEAREAAYRQWRHCIVPWDRLVDMAHPAQMEAAAARADAADVEGAVRISADLGQHIAWLRDDVDRGFDALYLHEVSREQERFIQVFGRDVLPRVRR